MPTAMAAPHCAERGEKSLLRRALAVRRAACDPALGIRMAGHALASWIAPPGALVAGYWPLRGEIDPRPLMLALAGRGHRLALPETPRRGLALSFRAWRVGEDLVPGRFGTSQSTGPRVDPDVLLVPLLGFDHGLDRLGYGGGYYDRTLEARPGVRAIGCAFACQRVDTLPTEPTDRPLDLVVTEEGVLMKGRRR